MICIFLLLGFCTGVFVAKAFLTDPPVGSLRIIQSDESSEPYLFLELDDGIEYIYRKKCVRMRVKIEKYISHE